VLLVECGQGELGCHAVNSFDYLAPKARSVDLLIRSWFTIHGPDEADFGPTIFGALGVTIFGALGVTIFGALGVTIFGVVGSTILTTGRLVDFKGFMPPNLYCEAMLSIISATYEHSAGAVVIRRAA
jgi:hypothetical protein